MKLSLKKLSVVSVLAISALAPLAAHAHRMWLLPSATVMSGNDPWVTVDAAVSNDLFYFDHFPLRLDGLVVTGPDGNPVKVDNANTGRYRSVFDVHLTQEGTYKIAVENHGLVASYKLNGETRRWRGNEQSLAKEVPADAQDLQITQTEARVESFVTRGKPTTTALKTTGRGLEMTPVTHPNDLVANGDASFRLLLDGKPASNVKVEVVPGGVRYRDQVGETTVTTDADGRFNVKWPSAGMYWMEASVQDSQTTIKNAKSRRVNYAATFEVLPQ
ncbi:Uncharacterized conserved protein, contains GH25 family domain [Paraburkholderia fungorum]|uniref:Uncharacterized conserved protein, contains GH25 family domain n=1 Tax=Paraburkholderia fungorum TaxID=134537 RepID=A0A1H1IQT4_9BURK|nr:DUF4198 domain-containing protein [Paraburkholderia fungorum]SDR40057.1 Uncharacterized conserved protein, contains GH25 family domain [Paraburkholderia fungorum]